jgi:hypothetical protein
MNDPSEQFDSEMDEKTVNIGGQQVPMSEVTYHVMQLLKSPKKLGSSINRPACPLSGNPDFEPTSLDDRV